MFCNDMAEAEARAFLARLGKDAWPDRVGGASGWSYGGAPQVEATYVVCLRDGILPVPWQHIFAERFGARRIVNIDAGHQVMNTRPQALAEVLRAEAG
jgi:hypothetical protein